MSNSNPKQFSRTAGGKALLIFGTVLFGFLFAISLLGVFLFSGRAGVVYSLPEETVLERLMEAGQLDAAVRALVHGAYLLRYWIYVIAAVSFLLALVCFVFLLHAVGRKPGTEEIFPGPLHELPSDLLVIFTILCGAGLLYAALRVFYPALAEENWYLNVKYLFKTGLIPSVCLGLLLLVAVIIGLVFCMSVAGKVKNRTLWKNTVICRLAKWVGKRLKKLVDRLADLLPGMKTVLLIFFVSTLLEIFAIVRFGARRALFLLIWIIGKVLLLAAALFFAPMLRKLRESASALANGEVMHITDTEGLLGEFRKHGEDLNRIAIGVNTAVEERLKSERTKTELITNVSHDIKTPLTSIINYASLIAAEPGDSPAVREYSEVLVRQSVKLKRLLEDLIEVSKAVTGNLEVSLAPCDACVFLTQAVGEYGEKFEEAGLSPVVRQPEKGPKIMADSRRMWRVFDNLMNNICRYSMPGSRVFLSLEERDGNAVFSFRNISREPLALSAEELTERFTRGDPARGSEGHGLGLAIAASMAELQGGRLALSVDGDLFKAELFFLTIEG